MIKHLFGKESLDLFCQHEHQHLTTMPTYRYEASIPVHPDEDVTLSLRFPDHGSAAAHDIDKPGPNDTFGFHELDETLGKGRDLINDRVVIWTTAFNLDGENKHVRVRYLIDGEEVLLHSNKKSEDKEPTVKLTLTFSEA